MLGAKKMKLLSNAYYIIKSLLYNCEQFKVDYITFDFDHFVFGHAYYNNIERREMNTNEYESK